MDGWGGRDGPLVGAGWRARVGGAEAVIVEAVDEEVAADEFEFEFVVGGEGGGTEGAGADGEVFFVFGGVDADDAFDFGAEGEG